MHKTLLLCALVLSLGAPTSFAAKPDQHPGHSVGDELPPGQAKRQANQEKHARKEAEKEAKRRAMGHPWYQEAGEQEKWHAAMEREQARMNDTARERYEAERRAAWEAEMQQRREDAISEEARKLWELESYREEKLRQIGRAGAEALFDEVADQIFGQGSR